MRWQAHSLELSSSQSILASQTDKAISFEFNIVADPCLLRVDVTFSSLTVASDMIIKVQDYNGSTWRDVKINDTLVTSVSPITYSLTLSPWVDTGAGVLPMRDRARVTITTGVGDTATITDVRVCRMED